MSWVSSELRDVELGDERLALRLMRVVEQLASHCEQSVPVAFGSWAEVKGAYRLWENPRVDWRDILRPHGNRTAERALKHPVVLVAQDTTEINLTSRRATKGLGYLGAPYCRGLLLHTCLAMTPGGEVLGVVDQQIWARPLSELGKNRLRHRRATAAKESQRWLDGLAASAEVLSAHPQVVIVGDRESDFYDFYAAPRPANVEFVVRVQHASRKLEAAEATVAQALAEAPMAGHLVVKVPRSGGRAARVAHLTVQFVQRSCPPPHPRSRQADLPRVPLTWILVTEPSPPGSQKPIRWLLATSLPVATIEDALRCVSYYVQRWKIERFHFTLKSGCQVEHRALETSENLERMLTTMSIVAWRVMWLVTTARERPDEPCTRILCEAEWQVLHTYTHRKQPKPLPETPPTMREAVRMIAALGGFLGRKGDGEPGLKAVWKGQMRLSDMTTGWLARHPPSPASASSEDSG